MTRGMLPQIKWRPSWHIQQHRVFLATLYTGMGPRQGILIIMANVLIESLVLVFADLIFRTRPQCQCLVNGLLFV